MSLYNKNLSHLQEKLDIEFFIHKINESNAKLNIEAELDLIWSNEFGITFHTLWNSSSIDEKIEIVMNSLLIGKNATYKGETKYRYVKSFSEKDAIVALVSRCFKFLDIKGYDMLGHTASQDNGFAKIVKVIPTELSTTMAILDNEDIETLVYDFASATTVEQMEKILFKIVDPYIEEFENLHQRNYETLNLTNIKWRTQVLVLKTGEAINNPDITNYFSTLTNNEKMNELESLLYDWLRIITTIKVSRAQ